MAVDFYIRSQFSIMHSNKELMVQKSKWMLAKDTSVHSFIHSFFDKHFLSTY